MTASDRTATAGARAEKAIFAPFALLRVAGLPHRCLVDLSPPLTSALADEAVAAAAVMEATCDAVDAALYAAAPLAGDRTRRHVLALKRAVHNRTRPSLTSAEIAAVRCALDPAGEAQLDRWCGARRRMDDCLSAVEPWAADELRLHVRPGLRALLAREDVRRPLALSAPTLLERIERAPAEEPAARAAKWERSALGYLMRGAAKTTPFSTFMHIAVLDARRAPAAVPTLDASDRGSRTALDRGLAFALRDAALGCCGDLAHTAFLTSSTTTWISGGARSMAPAYAAFAGRVLRVVRPITWPMDEALAARVARLPARFTWSDLMALLAGAGLSAPHAAALGERLRRYGVIATAPWADAFSPSTRYADGGPLGCCQRPQGRRLRARLEEMNRSAEALAGASAADRLTAVERIGATARDAAAALGGDVRIAAAAPVVEYGYFTRPGGPVGAAIGGLLDEVAALLARRLEPRAHHIALRDLFVELYGQGATCHDAVAFLCLAAERLGTGRAHTPGSRAEHTAVPRPRVATTVLLQLSTVDDAALARGEALAVVNAIHRGCGWLSARHASGDARSHAALREALRAWIHTLAAPAEPVDLLLSGDCNELQAHPRLTARTLACPLEPDLQGPALSWRDVTLRHDPDAGLIEVESAGVPIAPVYLGGTAPHAGWGPTYWLTVIANPWQVRPFDTAPPAIDAGDEVVRVEREVVGRVVTRRAAWWMTTARARQSWFRHRGARRVIDAAVDCARWGIPQRFFATLRAPTGERPAKRHRKPFWVDARNPLFLDVLEHLSRDAEFLCITEPLPDAPAWPRLADDAHVSELCVEIAL